MQQLAPGWTREVERGPDWLFVRLHIDDSEIAQNSNLAESLWSLLQQHFIHRLVLELDDLPAIRTHLIGQLVLLRKRIHSGDGLLRICGLSEESVAALRASGLESRLPHFRDRAEAVMGNVPNQPR